MQLDQLIDFAELTLSAGPERVYVWAKRGMDSEAPTPVNWRQREKSRPRDVFLLASDKGGSSRTLADKSLTPPQCLLQARHMQSWSRIFRPVRRRFRKERRARDDPPARQRACAQSKPSS